MLHVVHRRLIAVKESMFCMVERSSRFVRGPDVVFRVGMFRRLFVVPCGGLVMIRCDEMKRPTGEIRRR